MMQLQQNATVRLQTENNVLSAFLYGEIDHHCAKRLREEIDNALLTTSPDKLEIHMDGVSFMDSSGLGLILGRFTKTKQAGMAFAVCGAQGRIRQMFDMAGLCRIITFEDTESFSEKKGEHHEKG